MTVPSWQKIATTAVIAAVVFALINKWVAKNPTGTVAKAVT